MFDHLPLLSRPSRKPELTTFWLGAAITSLALACLLLYSGQPQASESPRVENLPPEQFFPPAFVHAVPEIGLMSKVWKSGPYLRAIATAWPVEINVADPESEPQLPEIPPVYP